MICISISLLIKYCCCRFMVIEIVVANLSEKRQKNLTKFGWVQTFSILTSMSLKQTLASIGTILMPIGLIGIFIGCVIDPKMGEKSFGVVNPNRNDINYYPFHFAAGIRDGVLGIIGLLLRFKYPVVLMDFYMILILIPLADFIIVKYYNGSFLDGIFHILGAIGTFILILLLKEDKTQNTSNKLKDV